jgi:hypothetical protein
MEKTKLKSAIELTAAILAISVALSISFGFVIWSYYLEKLGFTSDTVFQSRFILTGAVFILSYTVPFYFLHLLILSSSRNFSLNLKILAHLLIFFVAFTFLIQFFMQNLYLLPQWFGGAPPRVVSLIASVEDTDFFQKFGIAKGSGSDVQTANLCLLHEDDSYVILMLNDRILSLNKNMIKGFGSLPSIEADIQQKQCKNLLSAFLQHHSSMVNALPVTGQTQ